MEGVADVDRRVGCDGQVGQRVLEGGRVGFWVNPGARVRKDAHVEGVGDAQRLEFPRLCLSTAVRDEPESDTASVAGMLERRFRARAKVDGGRVLNREVFRRERGRNVGIDAGAIRDGGKEMLVELAVRLGGRQVRDDGPQVRGRTERLVAGALEGRLEQGRGVLCRFTEGRIEIETDRVVGGHLKPCTVSGVLNVSPIGVSRRRYTGRRGE